MIYPVHILFFFFSCLVMILSMPGITTVSAQNAANPDNQTAKINSSTKEKVDTESNTEDEDLPLPKISEMKVPSVEDLIKKRPVDWVVMDNDYVLVVEPVSPRPDTIGKLETAFKESYNWPKPKSKEEIDEQRKKRAKFAFIELTLVNEPGNPEYTIQRNRVKQIIHHEDQILKRIDELLKSNQLRTAYDMLLLLDRKHRAWPGFDLRQQQLLFLEAKEKQKTKQYEIALAFIEDLYSKSPNHPGLKILAGEIIDTVITQSVKEGLFRKAHFYLKRLATIYPKQIIVKKWRETFLSKSNSIIDQAAKDAQQKQYQQAIKLVMEAAIIWPPNPRIRESLQRYHYRYPVINVGVIETALDSTPYFLDRDSTRRHKKLTQIPMFEVSRVNQTPQYQSRFFEQWEPTDLGRRADFILRQSYASWESHPVLMAADIAQFIRKRITPGHSEYDERFDSYVNSVTTTDPFSLSVYFDRVPLRTEWLLATPITTPPLWEKVSNNPEQSGRSIKPNVFVSSRFMVDNYSETEVQYVRALPEPSNLRDFNVAQINEIQYPSFEKSFQALLAGELSALPFLPTKLVTYFQNHDEFNVVQSAIPLAHVLQFNPESNPLKIIELRRALAYAIDRKKILNESLLDESRLLNGRLTTAPYYTGLLAYNDQIPQREYNFRLAVALAVASQNKLGGNFPTLYMLCDPLPEAQQAAQKLITAWSRIGITVILIPNTAIEAKKKDLKWDIVYRTVSMTEPVMELWPFLTIGKGAQIESLEIFPDWMRQKLIELDEASDWDSATELLKKLQQQLYSMAHIIPLWEIDQFHVFRKNVKGYADRPLNFYDNVEQWMTTPLYPKMESFTQK